MRLETALQILENLLYQWFEYQPFHLEDTGYGKKDGLGFAPKDLILGTEAHEFIMEILEFLEIPKRGNHDALRITGDVEDRCTERGYVPHAFVSHMQGFQRIELGMCHGKDVESQALQAHDTPFYE